MTTIYGFVFNVYKLITNNSFYCLTYLKNDSHGRLKPTVRTQLVFLYQTVLKTVSQLLDTKECGQFSFMAILLFHEYIRSAADG